MQDLSANLKKAQEGNSEESQEAKHTCLLTFDALANDSSVRDILRTATKEEFEHYIEVVTICMSLSERREHRILN